MWKLPNIKKFQLTIQRLQFCSPLKFALGLCRVATLPGKTWKNLEFDNLGKKIIIKRGTWEIKKKLEKPRTFDNFNL